MKPILSLSLCLLPMLGTLHAADAQRLEKPNILFILADDLGYADAGSRAARTSARRTSTSSPGRARCSSAITCSRSARRRARR